MALGLLFSFLGVPAAWILAEILGAGSVALVTQDDLPVDEHLFTFARGTVGVFAALPLVGMNPLPYLLPGGASLMPAIARDVGADIRYVSLSQ